MPKGSRREYDPGTAEKRGGILPRLFPVLAVAGCLLAGFGMGSHAWAASPEAVLHSWKRIYYGQLDGRPGLLFAGRFDRAKPALGDIDGDGDLDLFLGRGDGRVMYFQNNGTAKKADWLLVNEAIPAFSNPRTPEEGVPERINVGANAAPALTDIDGDGDLDLFVGGADGKIRQYTNTGNRFLPAFQLETPDLLGGNVGLNVVVKFPDLNGDGLPDLTLGNEAGSFFIALNQGSRSQPRFCIQQRPDPECLHVMETLGALTPEDNAVPEWVDWDRDGDLDLLVGKSDGTMAFWRNIGTAREGAWELTQGRFQLLDAGGYAAPVFTDLNGDGAPDLLLAGDNERIAFYEGRPDNPQFPLWVESRNTLNILRLGGVQSRVRVASGDLDGDGDIDLVLGTRSGQLLIYQNVSKDGVPAFVSPRGPLLPTPQRAFSAPALVDADNDGDLDLIVGGRDGRLEWIENAGNAKQAQWRARSLFFAGVDVGSLSAPLFADMDGDGDPDLLVGSSLGQIVYYENRGGGARPDFKVQSVRFAGLRVAGNASPALFGWSKDTLPDLVVGDQTGVLVPAVRDPALALDQPGAYRVQAPWRGLEAEAFSAPHFADLNGDQRSDLLLGTGSGAMLVWRYEGSGPLPAGTARSRTPRSNIVEGELLTATGEPADLPASSLSPGAPPPVGGTAGSTASLPARATSPRRKLALEPIFVQEPSPLDGLKAGQGTHPAFHDQNGDGRPDLVIGNREGKLLLFLNLGGSWRPIPNSFAGYNEGRNASPQFVDLDGDGDEDMVVGNEKGTLTYFENTGAPGARRFSLRKNFFKSVRGGRNTVPALNDLNGDGRLDLLVGNLKGELQYYRNTGKRDDPFQLEFRRFIGLDIGVSATPAFADLTREKRNFLLVGSDKGKIKVLQPTSTSLERSSGWKENRTFLEGLNLPPGSRPALADIDGDGDVDMVVGSDEGPLVLFRNQAIQPDSGSSPRG